MSPRRKPAFQDFQEFSEPVPYQGVFRACPLSERALGLNACPLSLYHFYHLSEPVPCIEGLSLIGVDGGRGRGQEGACPLYWGRFRSLCGTRVKVKTQSGTNSAKMTQSVSE